jgi:hypothetical protein
MSVSRTWTGIHPNSAAANGAWILQRRPIGEMKKARSRHLMQAGLWALSVLAVSTYLSIGKTRSNS